MKVRAVSFDKNFAPPCYKSLVYYSLLSSCLIRALLIEYACLYFFRASRAFQNCVWMIPMQEQHVDVGHCIETRPQMITSDFRRACPRLLYYFHSSDPICRCIAIWVPKSGTISQWKRQHFVAKHHFNVDFSSLSCLLLRGYTGTGTPYMEPEHEVWKIWNINLKDPLFLKFGQLSPGVFQKKNLIHRSKSG